jgi:hypothetical protein
LFVAWTSRPSDGLGDPKAESTIELADICVRIIDQKVTGSHLVRTMVLSPVPRRLPDKAASRSWTSPPARDGHGQGGHSIDLALGMSTLVGGVHCRPVRGAAVQDETFHAAKRECPFSMCKGERAAGSTVFAFERGFWAAFGRPAVLHAARREDGDFAPHHRISQRSKGVVEPASAIAQTRDRCNLRFAAGGHSGGGRVAPGRDFRSSAMARCQEP